MTILGDDLDIVRVGGERFVFHDGLSYLLGDVLVRAIVLLLICGGLVLAPIPLINLRYCQRLEKIADQLVLALVLTLHCRAAGQCTEKYVQQFYKQLSSLFLLGIETEQK